MGERTKKIATLSFGWEIIIYARRKTCYVKKREGEKENVSIYSDEPLCINYGMPWLVAVKMSALSVMPKFGMVQGGSILADKKLASQNPACFFCVRIRILVVFFLEASFCGKYAVV